MARYNFAAVFGCCSWTGPMANANSGCRYIGNSMCAISLKRVNRIIWKGSVTLSDVTPL
ncbi:hypothetical protein YPPY72_3094 [Yersinia pestis PY-72]|uniref:Uncharacterized protein n=1 Tax=Yersinia pseudotuberculosis serotype O:3 (strain YPIII) TaxID=502800 RepID=A0A0H3B6S7_YERPY|nr:hypothetical protein YPPY72_3094 [Yersinia pestis PY-72]KGA53920.1 hypothetical protein DJ56_1874 [Yersinia pestis]KGA63877.1 hypothetical protein DJ55_2372 [Yersinia pseudotuberculosis]KNX85148.1 hypothetical protein ACX52_623 [Yersinia pestis]